MSECTHPEACRASTGQVRHGLCVACFQSMHQRRCDALLLAGWRELSLAVSLEAGWMTTESTDREAFMWRWLDALEDAEALDWYAWGLP